MDVSGSFLTSIDLAAFRAIKKDPDREVLTEILKAMFDARRGKQDIVRTKSLASAAANQLSAAAHDDVNFVTRMRCLRVLAARRIKLNHQRAMLENTH